MQASIASLHCYPLKSARGIALDEAVLTAAGLEDDRRWMVVGTDGRFRSQREWPQLALIAATAACGELLLQAPHHAPLRVALHADRARREVSIWKHTCDALDEGEPAAEWLQQVLGEPCRLVRFDPAHRRLSSRAWTGQSEAENRFSDAFPLLVIARASLEDLNTRLPTALPMERFRPNLVLDGVGPYEEDRIEQLSDDEVTLRLVKPCTRCRITTVDQQRGQSDGEEPLRTLRTFRYDPHLQGVCFGQNAIVLRGAGRRLRAGQQLQVRWRAPG